MEFTATARAVFSASHIIPGHLVCGRQHGHRWSMSVTIGAGQDPKTGVLVGSYELAAAVSQFAFELNLEDVNAMLPGSQPTAEGISLALRERLSLIFPTIKVVTVTMDDNMMVTLS